VQGASRTPFAGFISLLKAHALAVLGEGLFDMIVSAGQNRV
jgi:hypothetical protein